MRAPLPSDPTGQRGILNPRAGEDRFTLARFAPAGDLAAFVERHWVIHWDLRGRAPHAQETLPHPHVNLVFGTHRPGLHGVGTRRFVANLEGEGWVVGTKFRPGGFRPFWGGPIRKLTDRSLPIAEAFGEAGAEVDAAVHAAREDGERIGLIETFLRRWSPARDEEASLAAWAVGLVRDDASITRVAELARRVGVTMRVLQRVFSSYVGVPPKWVIRRFRIHEAAERVARGEAPSFSSLACDLGYFDQAHFIREFKEQVGRTPGEYAALCGAG